MARTIYYGRRPRGYGISNFTGDVILTLITGGLWLIWVLIRELSR